MEKKKESKDGIRMEIIQGEDSGVAVDALIDDVLHNRIDDALHDLHVPYSEDSHYDETHKKDES